MTTLESLKNKAEMLSAEKVALFCKNVQKEAIVIQITSEIKGFQCAALKKSSAPGKKKPFPPSFSSRPNAGERRNVSLTRKYQGYPKSGQQGKSQCLEYQFSPEFSSRRFTHTQKLFSMRHIKIKTGHFSRKAKVISKRVATNNSWSKYTSDSERLQNSMWSHNHIKKYHLPKHIEPSQYSSCGRRDQVFVTKRGNLWGVPKGRSVSEHCVLSPQKGWGQRPVMNLKHLNNHIPYNHFKMEGLHLLKEMLQEGDYMCKINLKDPYFSVLTFNRHKKFLQFKWNNKIYEFQCLCFGLGPAPLIFTKLLKVSIAILRRLNVRLIIYLDDILIMASSKEQLIQHRDTFIREEKASLTLVTPAWQSPPWYPMLLEMPIRNPLLLLPCQKTVLF